MKLKALVPTVFVVVALPAVALAGAPTQAEASNAAKICAGLKQAMGSPTFRATYGTNATRSDALGKCVCWAKIEQQDTQQATRLCATEQNDANFATNHAGKTFAQFYGTGTSTARTPSAAASRPGCRSRPQAAGVRDRHRRQRLCHRADGESRRLQGQVRHQREQVERLRPLRITEGDRE